MKVILFQTVDGLGLPGDIAEVKPGHFRNFLAPRSLAVEASPRNLKMLELKRKKLEAEAAKLREANLSLSDRIQKVVLEFKLKAGETGRLFGSVTAHDVADRLIEMGYEVDRKRVALAAPIKTLGNFSAKLRLAGGVAAPIAIVVSADAAPVPESRPEEPDYDEEGEDGEE